MVTSRSSDGSNNNDETMFVQPTRLDYLVGSESFCQVKVGNEKMRQLTLRYFDEWESPSTDFYRRRDIKRLIVSEIRQQGSRFLRRVPQRGGGKKKRKVRVKCFSEKDSQWKELGDAEAQKLVVDGFRKLRTRTTTPEPVVVACEEEDLSGDVQRQSNDDVPSSDAKHAANGAKGATRPSPSVQDPSISLPQSKQWRPDSVTSRNDDNNDNAAKASRRSNVSHDLLIKSNADRTVGDEPHWDCQGCRYRNAETNQKCAVCGGWKEKYTKQRGNTISATSTVTSVHGGVTEQQGCSVAHGRLQQATEIAKEQDMGSAANRSRQRPQRGVDTAAGKITQQERVAIVAPTTASATIMQRVMNSQEGTGVATHDNTTQRHSSSIATSNDCTTMQQGLSIAAATKELLEQGLGIAARRPSDTVLQGLGIRTNGDATLLQRRLGLAAHDGTAQQLQQRLGIAATLGGIMKQQQQGMGVASNGFDNPALAALLIGQYQNEAFLQHQQRQLRQQQQLPLAALGRGMVPFCQDHQNNLAATTTAANTGFDSRCEAESTATPALTFTLVFEVLGMKRNDPGPAQLISSFGDDIAGIRDLMAFNDEMFEKILKRIGLSFLDRVRLEAFQDWFRTCYLPVDKKPVFTTEVWLSFREEELPARKNDRQSSSSSSDGATTRNSWITPTHSKVDKNSTATFGTADHHGDDDAHRNATPNESPQSFSSVQQNQAQEVLSRCDWEGQQPSGTAFNESTTNSSSSRNARDGIDPSPMHSALFQLAEVACLEGEKLKRQAAGTEAIRSNDDLIDGSETAVSVAKRRRLVLASDCNKDT